MTRQGFHEQASFDPKQWSTMTDLGRYALFQRIQINHHRLKLLMAELDTCAYFVEQAET